MEWERLTNDEIEQLLDRVERKVSEARAFELEALEEIERRQVFTADGCRNLSEWVSQRLDTSHSTARSLVQTMRRTTEKPHLREALARGIVTYDRAEALSKLDEGTLLEHMDVDAIHRLAADRIEITRDAEDRAARDQFLMMQPSLDESWWRVWGGLDGLTGAVVDRVLTERADALPDLPDGSRGSGSWRRAIALYELATGGESPQAQVTVFVDAGTAAPTDGRAGVRLQAGPRVGAGALEAVLCTGTIEVTAVAGDGIPMSYGRRARNIPPALRRAVLARNAGRCEIFGCDSRYRVEVHHRVPWARGGRTDPDNLLAVCWFHHHIAIHQLGLEPVPDDKNRMMLRHPAGTRGPPVRAGTSKRTPLSVDRNRPPAQLVKSNAPTS